MVAIQTTQGAKLDSQLNDISVLKMEIAQLKDHQHQPLVSKQSSGFGCAAGGGWSNSVNNNGNIGHGNQSGGSSMNNNAGGTGAGSGRGGGVAGSGGNNFNNGNNDSINNGNNNVLSNGNGRQWRGNFSGRGGHRGRSGRPVIKCEPCQLGNLYCNHCNLCGELGHKRFDCPKKQ